MLTIHINRHELANGVHDIEDMVANAIKADLGAKKVTAYCQSRHWQGCICPEFRIKADGVKMLACCSIDPYDLHVDPWEYDMDITYDFAENFILL